MYCCKDLVDLKVLSLYEGELIGSVDKLFFDKTLKKLINVGLIGEDGTRWTIPTKAIYHIGPNAITIKNKQNVQLALGPSSEFASPINSKAYSIEGKYLGTIVDLIFNEKYSTSKLYLDNGQNLDIRCVTSCGKSTVIFSNSKTKIKDLVPKERTDTEKVPTLSVEENKNYPINTIDPSLYLIGRRSTKDIFNFNNELLIKANSIITKKHIAEVKKYGKLKELMLYIN